MGKKKENRKLMNIKNERKAEKMKVEMRKKSERKKKFKSLKNQATC